ATIIRSGQVVQVPGDFLLIGDVNPGGQIRSNGNVFVLGNIKGIIHAGFEGNENAVVAGKFLYPSQVRIAGKVYGFDSEDYKEVTETDLFSAFVNDVGEIVIDGIHKIRKIRPEISNFQGGR
ncbi:TPA: septum site-determining protein MinC, partial [Listeria monocytogenes]|nr:septum site-determining protein MinC [Listeria monocytogenes]